MLPNRGMLIWRPLTILEDRMRFTQILEGIDYILKGQDADISEIEYDSRRVQSGNLFAAYLGHTTTATAMRSRRWTRARPLCLLRENCQ